MDASKTIISSHTDDAAPTVVAAATAVPESSSSDEKKGGNKKQKGDGKKKSTGKRGQTKPVKGEKKPKTKERPDFPTLLAGISRPAIRRLFKQVHNHSRLRLSSASAEAIRVHIGASTRRITRSMVEAVLAAGRQTAYLCDARAAVRKELPNSSVFPQVASK